MKTLTNIYEGIFDTDTTSLEGNAMIVDPTSDFNRGWVNTVMWGKFGRSGIIPSKNQQEFEYKNDVLTVTSRVAGLAINPYKTTTKLVDVFPDIKGFKIDAPIIFDSRWMKIDQTVLGREITCKDKITFHAREVENVDIEITNASGHNGNVYFTDTISVKNVSVKGVQEIRFNNDDLPNVDGLKSPDLQSITIYSLDILEENPAELNNLIDWSSVPEVIDKKTNTPARVPKWNIKKIVAIANNPKRYQCSNEYQLAPGKHITDVFKSIKCPRLNTVEIMNNNVSVSFYKVDGREYVKLYKR